MSYPEAIHKIFCDIDFWIWDGLQRLPPHKRLERNYSPVKNEYTQNKMADFYKSRVKTNRKRK